jgi:Mrp family chromosome partitioning ATPase
MVRIEQIAASFADELYRLENALFQKDPDQSTVIQFTSSHFGEGVTCITLGLAIFMSSLQRPQSIVVVEANMRRPSFQEYLGIKPPHSILDVFTEAAPLDQAVYEAPKFGFHVLAAGVTPEADKKIEYGPDLQRLKGILAKLRQGYRFILLDSPPVVPFMDASIIGKEVDGVVVVVESNLTRYEVVNHTLDKLRTSNADLKGIILNKRELRIPKPLYRFL